MAVEAQLLGAHPDGISASQFAANAVNFLYRLESRDRFFGSLTGGLLDQPLQSDGLDNVLSLPR